MFFGGIFERICWGMIIFLFSCTGPWCYMRMRSFSSYSVQASCCGVASLVAVIPRHPGLVAPEHVESSKTRDGTVSPALAVQILIHCTTSKVPGVIWFFEEKTDTAEREPGADLVGGKMVRQSTGLPQTLGVGHWQGVRSSWMLSWSHSRSLFQVEPGTWCLEIN